MPEIPRKAARARRSGPGQMARSCGREDEPPIRPFLRPTLASQGYCVVEVETGKEGLLQVAFVGMVENPK